MPLPQSKYKNMSAMDFKKNRWRHENKFLLKCHDTLAGDLAMHGDLASMRAVFGPAVTYLTKALGQTHPTTPWRRCMVRV
jgi:hypothetical protein